MGPSRSSLILNKQRLTPYSITYEKHKRIPTLQVISTILGITVVILNAKEKVFAWPLAVLGTILNFFIYYQLGLYAKCLLNNIHLALALYGWYQWLYSNTGQTPLRVSTTRPRTMRILLLVGIACAYIFWRILVKVANTPMVCGDSVHAALCLIAQWMTARKRLESWIIWIMANMLFAFVCYQDHLYWFSGLNACFIFLSAHGYRVWRQSYLKHTAATSRGL